MTHEGRKNKESRAYEKTYAKIADTIVRWGIHIEEFEGDDIYLKGFTVQTPYTTGEEFRVILRAEIGSEHVVAFHSGSTLEEVLVGAALRWSNKSLKWGKDKWHDG